MKTTLSLFLLLFAFASAVSADFQQILAQADRLHEEDRHEEIMSLLQPSLGEAATTARQAELQWRIARAWLNLGDLAEERGVPQDELLAFFSKGEEAARRAVELDPGNHQGYYWQSGNLGRWGQVKGILNALAKAKPMRDLLARAVQLKPGHPDSYYVLGQLYEQVPGFPVSFGNKEYAVSLGRKSVDLLEVELEAGGRPGIPYDFYTELARHLYARNWDAGKRARELPRLKTAYAARTDTLEKGCFYEGVAAVPGGSDREEALGLLRRVVREMGALPSRTRSQDQDLKEARDLLAGWE